METQGLNLFIVDDNRSMVFALKHYLTNKFGGKLKITTFYDGESCLKNINEQTDVVILDYNLNGKNGNEILKEIKELNPRIEVIMLSSNENVETAVEAFRLGAKNYVVKNPNSWRKLNLLINTIFMQPMRLLREFGVAKFINIFILTFITMGALVLLILKLR